MAIGCFFGTPLGRLYARGVLGADAGFYTEIFVDGGVAGRTMRAGWRFALASGMDRQKHKHTAVTKDNGTFEDSGVKRREVAE